MDYAKKGGNIEKLEKPVTDLSKKWDSISDEFKKITEELKKPKRKYCE